MIANSAPQLSWLMLSLPTTNPLSGHEIAVEQPSPPAVQVSAPQAEPKKVGPIDDLRLADALEENL
jgi:hypothetical protein